jgi:hypothetical protein
MKNISKDIVNSELKEFYFNNQKKINLRLRLSFIQTVVINGKKYKVCMADDLYRKYVYFTLSESCDLYNIDGNIYAIKYENKEIKGDIISYHTF